MPDSGKQEANETNQNLQEARKTSPEDEPDIPVPLESYDENDLEQGHVELERGEGDHLSIPMTCAICLAVYKEGETVVLSGNTLCRHGFHQDCILDYLVVHDAEAAPCPCCRQLFIPIQ